MPVPLPSQFEHPTFVFSVLKKILVISASLIYLLLTSGISIHLHYCCGKLAEVGVISLNKKCCSHEDDKSCCLQKNCCKFEEVKIKLDDVHRIPKVVELSPVIAEIGFQSTVSIAPVLADDHFNSVYDHDPPPIQFYKMNCSLVLYG